MFIQKWALNKVFIAVAAASMMLNVSAILPGDRQPVLGSALSFTGYENSLSAEFFLREEPFRFFSSFKSNLRLKTQKEKYTRSGKDADLHPVFREGLGEAYFLAIRSGGQPGFFRSYSPFNKAPPAFIF